MGEETRRGGATQTKDPLCKHGLVNDITGRNTGYLKSGRDKGGSLREWGPRLEKKYRIFLIAICILLCIRFGIPKILRYSHFQEKKNIFKALQLDTSLNMEKIVFEKFQNHYFPSNTYTLTKPIDTVLNVSKGRHLGYLNPTDLYFIGPLKGLY